MTYYDLMRFVSVEALIFYWIVTALFATNVAAAKGYNGWLWFIGGLIGGVVALLASIGMPLRRDDMRTFGEEEAS